MVAFPPIESFCSIVQSMASLRRLLEFSVMALATLVVAHQLVFLLAYGSDYDAALARSGHDGTWASTVSIVLLAAVCMLGLATWPALSPRCDRPLASAE